MTARCKYQDIAVERGAPFVAGKPTSSRGVVVHRQLRAAVGESRGLLRRRDLRR